MCFTVEIDKKRFPNVKYFLEELERDDVLFISNEFDFVGEDNGLCLRMEFDDNYIAEISSKLAMLIKTDFLKNYADELIKTNYNTIDIADKCSLIADVLNTVDTDMISSRIYKFLSENMHIHLGGFVFFRLKDYLLEFGDELDFAVDEYIREKKYHEFVSFLKFFVEIQEPLVDVVHIVIDRYGNYNLLDKNGKMIDKNILDSAYCEISTLDDNDGYIMLNDIISLSPGKIYLHCDNTSNNEYVKILKEIFGEKAVFCANNKML